MGTVYQDGENINLTMVSEGHGWWYRQYAKSAGELEDAEKAARLLDLSQLPKGKQAKKGERLARRLAMILKRLHPGSFSRISFLAQHLTVQYFTGHLSPPSRKGHARNGNWG